MIRTLLSKSSHFMSKNSRMFSVSLSSVNRPLARAFSQASKDDITMDVEGTDKDFQPQEKKPVVEQEESDEALLEQVESWVRDNKIVLFMKGSPQMPMCGYSRYVVETLKFYNIRDYKSVDVLKNQDLKRVIKAYSDWPTFPQLFINGELVGGCDIIQDMHKQGTLKDALSKNA